MILYDVSSFTGSTPFVLKSSLTTKASAYKQHKCYLISYAFTY